MTMTFESIICNYCLYEPEWNIPFDITGSKDGRGLCKCATCHRRPGFGPYSNIPCLSDTSLIWTVDGRVFEDGAMDVGKCEYFEKKVFYKRLECDPHLYAMFSCFKNSVGRMPNSDEQQNMRLFSDASRIASYIDPFSHIIDSVSSEYSMLKRNLVNAAFISMDVDIMESALDAIALNE